MLRITASFNNVVILQNVIYFSILTELRFSPDEAELVVTAGPAPRKTASVSAFTTPPTNPVSAIPISGDGDVKVKSKWKLTKKVNRIYADWLDDLSPPRSLADKEEI